MTRRTLWAVGIAAALSLGVHVLIPDGRACSCIWPPPPLDALAQADMVFVGKVIARREPEPRYVLYEGDSVQTWSSADMIGWRLVVTQGWKGDSANVVTLYSPRDGASCGYGFQLGESYLVYATLMEESGWLGPVWPEGTRFPALTTHLCTRTQSLECAGADLAELGEPAWVVRAIPAPARLEAAWPNPTQGAVSIRYEILLAGHARLSIFDVTGRRVTVLWEGRGVPGKWTAGWDCLDGEGRRVTSGMYFARLESHGVVTVKKVVVAR